MVLVDGDGDQSEVPLEDLFVVRRFGDSVYPTLPPIGAVERGGDDPYTPSSTVRRPMFPDFVVFRRQGSGIVCDILEPHALAFEDSVAKAKGPAEFGVRLCGEQDPRAARARAR